MISWRICYITEYLLFGKFEILILAIIFTSFNSALQLAITLQELLLSREVYEIGAQYSVATKDVASFERYMSMLKSIYTDQSASLPESSRMYELLGLNLLFLLSQNRLGDFHTELELLPPDILLSNPYIESPVQLEQFIMEGKYNKVIDTRYNVPADSYKFFIDVLLVTIRDEIGKSEKLDNWGL